MDIRLDGKRALISGAGKGIGRQIALTLAECGAEIVAISRTAADLESLSREIQCRTIVVDLEDADSARRAARDAGAIDLLVNNAGISVPESLLESTVEAFDRTMAINVRAALVLTQVIARRMIERGKGGAIVNVSSQASMVGFPDHAAYCASKGALDQLTRVMAIELGPHQIRVNSVNPTVVLTPMGEMAWADLKKRSALLAKIPLGRFAMPRDIANAVAYLLSDKADLIHGAMLPIDGGFLAT